MQRELIELEGLLAEANDWWEANKVTSSYQFTSDYPEQWYARVHEVLSAVTLSDRDLRAEWAGVALEPALFGGQRRRSDRIAVFRDRRKFTAALCQAIRLATLSHRESSAPLHLSSLPAPDLLEPPMPRSLVINVHNTAVASAVVGSGEVDQLVAAVHDALRQLPLGDRVLAQEVRDWGTVLQAVSSGESISRDRVVAQAALGRIAEISRAVLRGAAGAAGAQAWEHVLHLVRRMLGG